MTKAEVAHNLAKKLGLSHKQSVEALEVFLASIKEALQGGDKVSLVGFGTFYVKERNARNGRNPRTGTGITIPQKVVPTFKPGKAFRDVVKNLDESQPLGPAIEVAPAENYSEVSNPE
jgi:DNA-binding protein HU-beta